MGRSGYASSIVFGFAALSAGIPWTGDWVLDGSEIWPRGRCVSLLEGLITLILKEMFVPECGVNLGNPVASNGGQSNTVHFAGGGIQLLDD